jgi:hypothetical protein
MLGSSILAGWGYLERLVLGLVIVNKTRIYYKLKGDVRMINSICEHFN